MWQERLGEGMNGIAQDNSVNNKHAAIVAGRARWRNNACRRIDSVTAAQ
jgi:hypothetical protein